MTTFEIEDVFKLVSSAIEPYFHAKKATVVDDDRKSTEIPLTNFVLRCVAEEMRDRWTGDDDNKKKVVETALKNGGYDTYVIPTGEVGGLSLISGGRRGRSIGTRKTRRRHK
jgi:hypothetical protein